MHTKIKHWKTHWDRFSERHLEWVLGFAFASLCLGTFFKITVELQKDAPLRQMDQILLIWVAHFRTPLYTRVALDVTALGSPVVLGLVCVIGVGVCLWVTRDRWAALQLILAASGAGLWVGVGKHLIGRSRPEAINALVLSQGYSYPSGHSLSAAAIYLTLALLACRRLSSAQKRWAVMSLALGLIGVIGLSRTYLGVHYPSDVMGGLFLGAAWALGVEALRTYFSKSARHSLLPPKASSSS